MPRFPINSKDCMKCVCTNCPAQICCQWCEVCTQKNPNTMVDTAFCIRKKIQAKEGAAP
jgi:hypothetical protein